MLKKIILFAGLLLCDGFTINLDGLDCIGPSFDNVWDQFHTAVEACRYDPEPSDDVLIFATEIATTKLRENIDWRSHADAMSK